MQWSGSQTTSSALRPSYYNLYKPLSSLQPDQNSFTETLKIFTLIQITTSNIFNLISSVHEHINELHSNFDDDFFTVAFQITVYISHLQPCTGSNGYRIIYKSCSMLSYHLPHCWYSWSKYTFDSQLLLYPIISPYLVVTPYSQIIMEKFQFGG